MRGARKRHSFIDTLKGPVSTSRVKEIHPSTAAKYIRISQYLIDHGYEVDWGDETRQYFIKGSKQVTLFVPPSY
jgi:hypothetical protein